MRSADESLKVTMEKRDQDTISSVPINLRSVVLAFVFLIPLIILIQYAEFTNSIPSIPTLVAPSVVGVFIVLLLLAFNRIASRVGKQTWCITQRELVTIYVLVGFGGFLASLGLVGVGVGIIAGLYCRSLEVPNTYLPILENIPSWAVIKDEVAGTGFWMGGSDVVPWTVWFKPLLFWSVIWTAMLFIIICMFTLVRKHWHEREKLTYPLTVPVLELCGQSQLRDGANSPFWKNRIFLFGLIWPVFNGIMSILHGFSPVVPAIPSVIQLYQFFTEPPFSAVGEWMPLQFTFNSPAVTGIGYLVSTEITFSLWFFHILYHVLRVLLQAFQGTITIGKARWDWELGRGVMVGVALTSLWFVRGNIWSIIKRAFRVEKSSGEIDADEPVSYSVAFWGGLISLLIVFFATTFVLRINFITFFIYLAVFLGISLSFIRLRAEAGYPVNMGSVSYLYEGVMRSLPESLLDKSTLASLGVHFNNISGGGAFSGVPGLVGEAYKFAEESRISRRSMTKWIAIFFVITFLFGSVIALPIIYRNGLLNMDFYRAYHSRLSWAHVPLEGDPYRDPSAMCATFLIGIVIAIVLQIARVSFVWWPFNTLTMGIATDTWVGVAWGPFFIAWIVKTAIMRYGGYAAVKRLQPFFIALILGSAAMSGLQALIFIVRALLT